MLEGVSAIKDKVYRARYQPSEKSKFDVDAVIAELKKDPKFKNFTDEELHDYAYTIKDLHNAQVVCGDMNKMGFDTGKPKDPFWSQFTYEEILNMVNDGVSVPQEFIDWAYTKQDADTVSYQIETSTEDSNAYENLDSETGNIDQSDIQKRAQAFASKAKAQEELIHNRTEEAKPLVNKVQSEKNELERNQKMSLQKIESMTNEWKTLDLKFKKGADLSEAEQKRYQELGVLLNDNNGTLVQQAQKVSGDIDELMDQIENIDMLLNINEKINAEIENVGTKMSWFEGNKQHIILPTHSGNQTTGLSSMIYSAAMGNNLAIDTGLTGVNLFFNNLEVSREIDTNTTVADKTQERVDIAYDAADNKDENLKRTTNKQAENKGNEDNKAEENKFGAQVQNPQNTEEQNDPALNEGKSKAEVIDEVNAAPDTKLDAKTVAVDNTASKNTANNITAPTTEAPDEVNASATTATPETSEAGEVVDTSAAAETSDTTAETEDPLKAATQQYVDECQTRSSSMAQEVEQVQTKAKEIQLLKMSQKVEEAKLNKELNKNITEYESFAKKVESGQQLTDSELKRIEAIEKAINSQNGTLIEAMKNKVNNLSGFVSDLQSGIQRTEENTSYGEKAVAKGKEYAKSVLGDREYLKDSMFGFIPFSSLSKEKQYDLLYGKAGESLGRDAIDNGELLIGNSAKSNKALSKILPLGAFAEQYAQDLTAKMGSTKQKVNSIQDSIKKATGADSTTNGKTSTKKSNKKDKNEKADANDIKQKGNNVKQDGKEAQREGQAAKREKQQNDKQTKKETNELKKTAATIGKMRTESLELNQQNSEMNAEAEVLSTELQAAENENSEQAVQPVALNSNARTGGATISSNNSSNTDELQMKSERLQAISVQSAANQGKIEVNNKQIKVMNTQSSRKVKQIQKTSEKKHKLYQRKIQNAEESQKGNMKFQGKVNEAAKIFNGVMLLGIALMAVPWTHGIGVVTFKAGQYGTVTCYTTNGVINAANGNLKGALVNFGAAALSFVAGNGAANVANGVLSQIAAQSMVQGVIAGAAVAAANTGAVALQKAADKQLQGDDNAAIDNQRKRRLVSFEERQARRAKLDKIEKSNRAYMARARR